MSLYCRQCGETWKCWCRQQREPVQPNPEWRYVETFEVVHGDLVLLDRYPYFGA